MDSRSYIIVAALELELQGLESYAPLVYTGVGKINAAIHLYKAILRYHPDLVINYGTAGALKGHSGLLKVSTIVQRDMDARPLGFARGVTPFSDEELPVADGIVLGSGDCFMSNPEKELDGLDIAIDLVDMEGFALQEVCRELGVAFDCYKYVTDSGDDDAGGDWQENVAKGASIFKELLQAEYGQSALAAT